MIEHDNSSPAREAAAASDQIDRELFRILRDARRRYVKDRQEILGMLGATGPLRPGLIGK